MNVCLGMLYPRLNDYIRDPDQFAHDFRNYLEQKKGGANQKLLNKIYEYLAYEKQQILIFSADIEQKRFTFFCGSSIINKGYFQRGTS